MRIHSLARGVRATIVLVSAAGTLVAATIASASPVAAASNVAVQGQLQAFPVSGSYKIAQLFSGSDGQLWFATTHSQLGTITPSGQATLTTTILPHGAIPAVIAGAGPEGVWSYGNEATAPFSLGACVITLITPGGAVEPVTLPSIAAPSGCGGAAADASGNLWISLGNPCGAFSCGRRVSFVAEITPSRVVTIFPPVRPGARTGPVTIGDDGAAWTLGGSVEETMGRYTTTGITTGITVPDANDLIALLPSSGGTFWAAKPVLCIGQLTEICLQIHRFAPGTSESSVHIFPVGISLGSAHQLGVDAAGALWEAGGERSDPDRFFRMNVDGTIDRSTAFPTEGGAALHTDGTLAVAIDGDLWASAQTTSGHEYLVRFVPTP
jgi:streptogramin lyase